MTPFLASILQTLSTTITILSFCISNFILKLS